jgi:hypothetical protein
VGNERSVQCTESVTESFNFRNTSAKVNEVMTGFHYTKGAEVPDQNMVTLVNDQLDVRFFYFLIRLLQSSTCFEQRRAHHQEVKLY